MKVCSTEAENVFGSDGEKIGAIGKLYADDDTGEPTWKEDMVYAH